jgi:hypothetical protein
LKEFAFHFQAILPHFHPNDDPLRFSTYLNHSRIIKKPDSPDPIANDIRLWLLNFTKFVDFLSVVGGRRLGLSFRGLPLNVENFEGNLEATLKSLVIRGVSKVRTAKLLSSASKRLGRKKKEHGKAWEHRQKAVD